MAIDPKEKPGKKSPLLGRDLDDDPVMATTKAANALEKKILERSRDDNDGFVGSGYMAKNQSVEGGEVSHKKKEKEKHEKAIKRILKESLEALNEQLAKIRAQITELDGKIEELEEEKSETEKALEEKYGPDWREKRKRGEIPDNDPLIIQLTQQEDQIRIYKIQRDRLKHIEDDLARAKESGDPEQMQKAIDRASDDALWRSRTTYEEDGPESMPVTLAETGAVLADRTGEGKKLDQNLETVQQKRYAKAQKALSGWGRISHTKSLDGEGSFKEGVKHTESPATSLHAFAKVAPGNEGASPDETANPAPMKDKGITLDG